MDDVIREYHELCAGFYAALKIGRDSAKGLTDGRERALGVIAEGLNAVDGQTIRLALAVR